MISLKHVLCCTVGILTFVSGPALADRKPTLEERAHIENRLKAWGYTSWDEIEFDDERNAWEVDDARASDGKFYDLKLDPRSLDIVKRKRDD
ncbi:PepSY domain-containing protein [Brucella intermedia]|uniref:PepSY domain-containing protein n=1 Tax=Brucella intermedia TaxID=94625 RepID=UPI00224A9773|nr:PepSY domain-containing protein [Brucella intermedia]